MSHNSPSDLSPPTLHGDGGRGKKYLGHCGQISCFLLSFSFSFLVACLFLQTCFAAPAFFFSAVQLSHSSWRCTTERNCERQEEDKKRKELKQQIRGGFHGLPTISGDTFCQNKMIDFVSSVLVWVWVHWRKGFSHDVQTCLCKWRFPFCFQRNVEMNADQCRSLGLFCRSRKARTPSDLVISIQMEFLPCEECLLCRFPIWHELKGRESSCNFANWCTHFDSSLKSRTPFMSATIFQLSVQFTRAKQKEKLVLLIEGCQWAFNGNFGRHISFIVRVSCTAA